MVDVALEIDDGRVMSATTSIGLTAPDDVTPGDMPDL